ncbi:EthD family reductase [Terriglobus roseus]|uniref:EthD domain-containing protein n=1 Tax=Terriglobus roseus TaxID=392734 RepID=A0A1H4Q1C0_9BACT|nr:EthD family reductase [Terriglobus roseus]SEC13340.1 conserved hypothetical protein [Terriglobus roseus]
MIVLSVLYPKTAGARFDYEYYLNKHMPLASARFSSMTKSTVMRGVSAPDGSAPAYEVLTLLEFPSAEALAADMEAHGADVTGDVRNATDIQPLLQINEVLEQGPAGIDL